MSLTDSINDSPTHVVQSMSNMHVCRAFPDAHRPMGFDKAPAQGQQVNIAAPMGWNASSSLGNQDLSQQNQVSRLNPCLFSFAQS